MRLAEIPADTRKRLLAQSFHTGTQLLRISDDTFLVKSRSQEGVWYEVTPSTCVCQGNARVGYCNHRIRVGYELHRERKEPISRPTNISRVA